MDGAWIGLFGVVGGVILTNGFQMLQSFIAHNQTNSERWIENKRESFSSFILNADIYFKQAISLVAGRSPDKDAIANSRDKLDISLADILVTSNDVTAEAAEKFERWIHNTVIGIQDRGKKLSNKQEDEFMKTFFNEKRKFLKIARSDLN